MSELISLLFSDSCRVNVKCSSRARRCQRELVWLGVFLVYPPRPPHPPHRQPVQPAAASQWAASLHSRRVFWPTKKITRRRDRSHHHRLRPWPAAAVAPTAAIAACPVWPAPEARSPFFFSLKCHLFWWMMERIHSLFSRSFFFIFFFVFSLLLGFQNTTGGGVEAGTGQRGQQQPSHPTWPASWKRSGTQSTGRQQDPWSGLRRLCQVRTATTSTDEAVR